MAVLHVYSSPELAAVYSACKGDEYKISHTDIESFLNTEGCLSVIKIIYLQW